MTPNRITSGLLALALGSLIVGCNQSAGGYTPKPAPEVQKVSISEDNFATFFPLEVGNQWVYESTTTVVDQQGQRSSTGDITFRVASVTPTGNNGVRAVVNVLRDGEVVDSVEWMRDSTGLYQTAAANNTQRFDPPQILLPYPYEQGTVVPFAGNGPRPLPIQNPGPFESENVLTGSQPVDTEMGTMAAIGVETTTRWTITTDNGQALEAAAQASSFYAPGVGLIRFQQTAGADQVGRVTQRLVLKSHQLKE